MAVNDEVKALRDKLRAQALKSQDVKKVLVTFNGAEIELRQVSLRVTLASRPNEDKMSAAERSVRTFIDHAFIPGTDVKVFEDADVQTLMNMPFNKEWVDIQGKILELSGIKQADVDATEKELANDPLGGQS